MKRLTAFLLVLLLLSGCAGNTAQTESSAGSAQTDGQTQSADSARSATEPNSITVFAMDTVMELTAYGADDNLMQQAEQEILNLESRLSVTDENSEIYAVNRDGGGTVSASTEELMQTALEMCEKTNGALDISVYPVLRAWGFTTGSYQIPAEEDLQALLESVDYTRVRVENGEVTVEDGMEVDLGSVAKGYTGDTICGLLRENGVTSALLNLGGNVQLIGGKPDGSDWRVAVQDPESDGYLGILSLQDKAAVTSGGYERYFVGEDGQVYWHIIDPSTGRPAHSGLISVTVVGDRGVICDALSTSLFVMGLEKAADYWRENGEFEAVFVLEDGSVAITSGLEECFTLADGYTDRTLTVIE